MPNGGIRVVYHSDFLSVAMGIPQGAILLPRLFTLFVNEVYPFLVNYSLVVYTANSTVLINDSSHNVENTTNIMLHGVSKWLSTNRLYFNKSETKFVNFNSSSQLRQDLALAIGSDARSLLFHSDSFVSSFLTI